MKFLSFQLLPLQLKKFLLSSWYDLKWRNVPFEIAHCEYEPDGKYDYDLFGRITKLAEFDVLHTNQHYLIYLRYEQDL
jgi:hypothetical protein